MGISKTVLSGTVRIACSIVRRVFRSTAGQPALALSATRARQRAQHTQLIDGKPEKNNGTQQPPMVCSRGQNLFEVIRHTCARYGSWTSSPRREEGLFFSSTRESFLLQGRGGPFLSQHKRRLSSPRKRRAFSFQTRERVFFCSSANGAPRNKEGNGRKVPVLQLFVRPAAIRFSLSIGATWALGFTPLKQRRGGQPAGQGRSQPASQAAP